VPASIAVPWLPESLAPYRAALVEAAQRHDVDPALVAIVTLVESMGNPQAESSGGARGLMQLMPSTAAGIASQRQLAGHSDERLFEPEYNLDLGAFLLSQLLKAHGSVAGGQRSVELAAVEYNAGPKLTSAYLAGSGALPDETTRYRDLVVALWNERALPESPAFSAWQASLKQR
jgi:soluble lytic murein transglycosylase-like protein